jgi:hypothetical protein
MRTEARDIQSILKDRFPGAEIYCNYVTSKVMRGSQERILDITYHPEFVGTPTYTTLCTQLGQTGYDRDFAAVVQLGTYWASQYLDKEAFVAFMGKGNPLPTDVNRRVLTFL